MVVYIISGLSGGGSYKYFQDLIKIYIGPFVLINTKHNLSKYVYTSSDILFVQHLLFTDISVRDLLKINCRTIITLHDFSWFPNALNIDDKSKHYENAYLNLMQSFNSEHIALFRRAEVVICPSEFIMSKYELYLCANYKLIPHIDLTTDYTTKCIPPVEFTINIGVFHAQCVYKGSEYVKYLKNINIHKKKNIRFVHFKYSENELYDLIEKHNIHGILVLNKYGETYCYALTKYINSGLPIFYNNIGSFKERIPKKDHYIVCQNSESVSLNKQFIINRFVHFLDYILDNQGKYNIKNYNTTISRSAYYDTLFSYQKPEIFCIYFPQFHEIPENNVNYYSGMTDIENLKYYKENINERSLRTPSLVELELTNMSDYNLKNKKLVERQISIAQEYKIDGFAIYYYWFTINSITNSNTIMESCYNNFFDKVYPNFKAYFMWANEDWSNNPAFNCDSIIKNEYTVESFENNCKNLMPYFKHENYKKIDNKPVFFIHHPFHFNNIDLFYTTLNRHCTENGFDGVHFVVNNLTKSDIPYKQYICHPNYKLNKTTDYTKYIDSVDSNPDIASIFFSFDNSARLCKPDKLHLSTQFKNADYPRFLNKCIHSKILLINSWNEWGENMAVEPSNEDGYYFLKLIRDFFN